MNALVGSPWPSLRPAAALRPDPRLVRTALRFAGWGPLVGGAPYNLFVFPIPFSYAIGIGPALVCGVLFALWRDAPARRAPRRRERVLFGALCGALAAALCSLVAPASFGWVLLVHSIPAGAVMAGLTPRPEAER